MQISKAFTFLNEDEQWLTKLLIGGVIAFLGAVVVPLFLLYGYSLELLQNVAAGQMRPLPEWDRLEEKFIKGLKLFAIRIVYFLPLLLLVCCAFGLIIVLSASANSNTSGSSAGGSGNPLSGIFSIVQLCLGCIAFVYAIVATLLSDAATLIFASTNQLNDAFKFGNVIALTRRIVGDLVMALLVTAAGGIALGLASLITCGLATPFASAYLEYVKAHLLGQIYVKAGLPPPPTSSMMAAPPAPPM